MHSTLLRVFVVALGLLTHPRDDPGVEEWDDITTVDMQKHEERLLRGEEKLDHEMAHIRKEINKELVDRSDQHVTEQDKMSDLDVSVTKQHSEEDNVDHKLQEGGHFIAYLDQQQNSKSEGETSLKTSQVDHEQKGNLQLDMKSKQGEDDPFTDPSEPHRQQEKLEEKEMFSSKEEESPLSHLHTKTSENETTENAIADWERDYLWYSWNIFSIISMIRFFRKYLGRNSQMKEETRAFPMTCMAAEVPLPDSQTLQRFHSKCIQVSSNNKWREDEFVEGFANDLLDAMRSVCDSNDGMLIEDFQMVGVCDIIVPFSPPDPYSFQCLLLNNQASDELLNMQVCGQIKLLENPEKKIQNGCHCQSPDADDMVCLLHCETEKVKTKITDVCDGLLCMKNSAFLSKSLVTRWFQSSIKQAWALISHKYEFDLNIPYIDAPGALVIRFRSGKKLSFSMNPVVKFKTDAHFFVTPCTPKNFDTYWTLSLTNYEDSLLEHMSKRLPGNSCHNQTLEIAMFLHRKQAALSGSSALKEFHFKTALMHLLLTRDPSQWKPNVATYRLRDLLAFVERSLEEKQLNHALIGNPLMQKIIELPAEFTKAKTVNLFHPLVVHNCIYRDALMHFQEMLRNANMLIYEYVDKCTDNASCSI